MPHREQFTSAAGYYQSALHELGHWSGPSRADEPRDPWWRECSQGPKSLEYSREELRAEISSMITGDRLNVGHDGSRTAAYVDFWVKTLQDHPQEIYLASRDAQGISDYLMERGRMLEHGKGRGRAGSPAWRARQKPGERGSRSEHGAGASAAADPAPRRRRASRGGSSSGPAAGMPRGGEGLEEGGAYVRGREAYSHPRLDLGAAAPRGHRGDPTGAADGPADRGAAEAPLWERGAFAPGGCCRWELAAGSAHGLVPAELGQAGATMLLDLQRRGLEAGPELAVGDGALEFWKALQLDFGIPTVGLEPPAQLHILHLIRPKMRSLRRPRCGNDRSALVSWNADVPKA